AKPRRRLHHRVFAGDVVGDDRDIDPLPRRADDIQIGKRRLDDDRISAFLHVDIDLAYGLANVPAVHLVRAAIAEGRRALGGLAEGAVVRGGVLGGVGHDWSVHEARIVERLTDDRDAAIHHVGRSNDIRTGTGVAQGRFREERQGLVIVDRTVDDDAAMPVAGVLAGADV